jgi:uncharacterized protein (TIGR00251 family)
LSPAVALPDWIADSGDGAALVRVRLQPRASGNRIDGERAGRLAVRVTAPPVEGRANDALCRVVAKAAGVAPSRVSVVRGAAARDKLVRVAGATAGELSARLGP